jgi:hypothetical protein
MKLQVISYIVLAIKVDAFYFRQKSTVSDD